MKRKRLPVLMGLPTDTPIITYCASGARSSSAATLLRNAGFVACDLGAMNNWYV